LSRRLHDQNFTGMDISWTFADNGGGSLPAIRCERQQGPFSLEMRTGAQCRFEPGQSNFIHYHQGFYEFCSVLSGTGMYHHGNQSHSLVPGIAFVADPNVRHEIRQHGDQPLDMVYWMVRIQRRAGTQAASGAAAEDLAVIDHFLQHRQRCWQAKPWLARWLHLLMLPSHDEPDPLGAWRADQLLWHLTMETLRQCSGWTNTQQTSTKLQASDDLMRRALAIIEQQCGQDLTVTALAKNLQCSERHLRRIFKQRLQRTPVQVLIERRLHQAAQHILRGTSIGDAAQQVGIQDPSQFTRLFRSRFGCTPSKYRQQHQGPPPALTWHTPPPERAPEEPAKKPNGGSRSQSPRS
jgi:AraC-like DNA-binding protein